MAAALPSIAELAALVPPALAAAGPDPAALLTALRERQDISADQQQVLATVLAESMAMLPDPLQALTSLTLFLDTNPPPDVRNGLFAPDRLEQVLALFAFSPGYGKALFKHRDWLLELLPVAGETPAAAAERLASVDLRDSGDLGDALRRLRAREFIRIALGDFLQFDAFEETTEKISRVADACVREALRGLGLDREPLTVIAMGKWGGLELNYSSDIDVLFVAGENVDPEDLHQLQRRTARLCQLLHQVTAEGFVFRVDNRLRPEGRAGPLVRTLPQYMNYYERHARGWEFQALVKARCAAGDEDLAARFLAATRPYVFNTRTPPEQVLRDVREMKGKIERQLAARHTDDGNVKLGAGGIRDIEFIVQFLQLHHGRTSEDFRHAGTLVTLQRFQAHRIITDEEYRALRSDYIFLRSLEHALQVAGDLPVRRLPDDPVAQYVLARKLGYVAVDPARCRGQLLDRYDQAVARTRAFFQALFDATIDFLAKKAQVRAACPDLPAELVEDHCDRLESHYFLRFSVAEIADHLRLIANLDSDCLSEVRVCHRPDGLREVTIVAWDYLGEFAKIAGLFSAYGQNIVNGESFTYSERPRQRQEFYRRPARHQYRSATRRPQSLRQQRKIVCVANVRPDPQVASRVFSWNDFQRDLEELLGLLRDGKSREASEKITLKVMDIFRRPGSAEAPRALRPIAFDIDNESDDNYTILEIQSPDQFMFLFEFTNVLSTRDYYIGKVEIATVGGVVHDRLFLTRGDGRKVVEEKDLRELRATITLIKQFAFFLPYAPNPHQALRQFSGLVDCVLGAGRQGQIPIIGQEDVMTDLARVLGASSFLWEDFLRMQHQHLLPILLDTGELEDAADNDRLAARLDAALAAADEPANALNRFKDEEMFRIDLRHLTGRCRTFRDFCEELTRLADVVMTAAYRLAVARAAERFDREEPGQSCIAALGKWGGREIGYGSDIEVVFVWDAGEEGYRDAVEFYEYAARGVETLVRSKRDGIFELDWRLRPGGRNAPLSTPWGRFREYFRADGGADTFERQAMLRLRTVAGDAELRRRVEDHRVAFVFGDEPFDVARIVHLRHRQQNELVGHGEVNAKFSPGGLVDAEYFVQVMQIVHGCGRPELQVRNTLEGITALHALGLIDHEENAALESAYGLLRAIINALRIVRGHAKDLVIPRPDSEDFAYLVRRLENFEYPPPADAPWPWIQQHMAEIHALFESLPDRLG